MGYSVEVSGTVRLPEQDEPRARELLRALMLDAEDGGLQEEDRVDTLEELACFAAAACARSGDRLVFTPDCHGDPTWSDQATAFWLGLGQITHEGHVRVVGEQDDEVWTYTYTPDGVVQRGCNGWDGTGEPDLADEDAEHGTLHDPAAAAEARRRRARRYLVFGAIPAAGGLALMAAGEGGLVPLGLGAVNLLIGWRLSRPAG